jgi:hypothetical protein
MKEIQLTQGKVALVDDEDYEWLSQYKWCIHSEGYAIRTVWVNSKSVIKFMHRDILNPPAGMFTDHINHNKTDNRRCNLRVCTISQNTFNSKLRSNNTSGIKGVSYSKKSKKWMAQIQYLGTDFYLGCYDNIEDAAIAYDNKSRELFGEFVYKAK